MKKAILNATPQASAGAQPIFTLISIEGGVWAAAPVSERPGIVLTDWHVFEVQLPSRGARTRHFAGYNITDREGRASSAIVAFDAETGRGRTCSGRVYELRGAAGFNGDGEYVWHRWLSINSAKDVVDVTAEITNAREQK